VKAPGFWKGGGAVSSLLTPVSRLFAAATARRVAQSGWKAPVPVICLGNATTGGAGKTTLALDLGRRLAARNLAVHFLIRGYGGKAKGARRVIPGDTADLVGDEALLLSEVAPTWTGADRADSARAAVAQGARVLIMDDGLQNPTLSKDLSLLVIDGGTGFGNGQVVPAGPLREPVAEAAARCQAAVLVGEDATGALNALPAELPILRARLAPAPEMQVLAGRRVLAFAGIAVPQKFFTSLEEAGAVVVGRASFADHHPYTQAEIDYLLHQANEVKAVAVTTPKDAARLTREQRMRVHVAGVDVVWENPSEIETLLSRTLSGG
jgi:tetraacyldisaccharide 4'-kinase